MSFKTIFDNALPARAPFYYGWVVLIFAAVAMVATLPGRSVGIGLITEPLIADLGISRLDFAEMNFWATIFGALFNLVCGLAIDRFGVRAVVTAVLFVLSLVVLGFSQMTGAGFLLLLLILMRGVGQSALSVVSLTMVGKWFVRRLSVAMGIFAVLMSLGLRLRLLLLAMLCSSRVGGLCGRGWVDFDDSGRFVPVICSSRSGGSWAGYRGCER